MTDYRFTTLSVDGVRLRQTRSFPGLHELDAFCRDNKLTLLSYHAIRTRQRKGRLSAEQARDFFEQLATLLESGIPLADALTDIQTLGGKPAVVRLIGQIQEAVSAGSSLSDTMRQHARELPEYVPAMLRAGEESGNLVEALRETTAALQWQIHLRQRIWRAVSYPLFSALMLLGALGFLMVYLVPQLEEFLGATGFDLPWYTQSLIRFSALVGDYAVPVMLLVGLIVSLVALLKRSSARWRGRIQRMFLRLPGVGRIASRLTLSRFFHFTGILYKAGIALPEAIRQAAAVSAMQPFCGAFTSMADTLSAGQSLSAAARDANLIPVMSLRILSVGEQGGQLDFALARVAELHQTELEASLGRLESRLGPAILLLVGVLMVWVIVAVISPVYDGISAMGIGL